MRHPVRAYGETGILEDIHREPYPQARRYGTMVVPDHGVRHSPNAATPRTGSLYRVLQKCGGWHEDVLPVLHVPGNKADPVPC